MRTISDRLRHALLYEALLLALLVPLGAATLHQPAGKIGALCLLGSLAAMGWNYLFNLIFDKALQAQKRPLYPRGFFLRMTHALFFEGMLVVVSVPAMMWWLDLGFLQALSVDLGFILLAPVYTLTYNWLYDLAFPAPNNPLELSGTANG